LRELTFDKTSAWDSDGLGNIVRGELFRLVGGLFRCTLDVCSAFHPVSKACYDEGFSGPSCPKGRPGQLGNGANAIEERSQQQQRRRRSTEARAQLLATPMRFHGEANHSYVEGIHSPIDGAGVGFWFYHARGSGVYANVGKSRAFRDHGHAIGLCGTVWSCDEVGPGGLPRLAYNAARNDVDSLQFTRFLESNLVKSEFLLTKINTPREWGKNFEEWGVNAKTDEYTGVCPPQSMAHLFRGGFDGSRECVCNSSLPLINCASSPSLRN